MSYVSSAMCGTVFLMCVNCFLPRGENARFPRMDFHAKGRRILSYRNARTAVELPLRDYRRVGICHHDGGMIRLENSIYLPVQIVFLKFVPETKLLKNDC